MVEKQEGDKAASGRPDQSATEASLAHDALIKDLASSQFGSAKDLLGDPLAPESKFQRYAGVTIKGVYNVPQGMANSAYHSLTHPLETLEIAGGAALLGAGLKVILPEAGPAGKIAGLAIGAYFTYEASKPIIEAYKTAGTAKTMPELDKSAVQIGNAGGDFIVHSAIAAVGYKAGAGATEHVLLSERFDRFADIKQSAWDGVGRQGKRLTDMIGVTKPEGPRLPPLDPRTPTPPLKDGTSRYWPSEKAPPSSAVPKGEIDPHAALEATVLLKSKGTDLAMDRALKRINSGRQGFLTDAQIAEKFGPTEQSLAEINKFATDSGLKVASADPRSGRVILQGEAGKFAEAFQTPLKEYQLPDGSTFRGREGALALPKSLQSQVQGVYGLDNRPHTRNYGVFPHLETPPQPAPAPGPEPRRAVGYLPNEIADAYKFPKESMGEGSSVAIVQLGGGLDHANEAAYYKQNGLPQPEIKVISVSGASTQAGSNPRFDGEVSLDSQIVGGIAPKAQQKVIFAPNTDAGFIDAVSRGTFHEAGEKPSTSISISWGAPEEAWTDQGMRGMNQAFKKAALKGISIFAAAGDDGAVDRAPSGRFNTDYPASDPNVTAAGGTRITIEKGQITSETAWNGSGGSSGGGISQRFERPDYQKGMDIPLNPQNPKLLGRGVPDIAGVADPSTGWKIKVGGVDQISGGTSAVAPMFAALDARISSALGRNVGPWNPFLYKAGKAGTGMFFNDTIIGDNNGYNTAFGWDPVTGWGSVNGSLLLDALKFNTSKSIPSNLVPTPITPPSDVKKTS